MAELVATVRNATIVIVGPMSPAIFQPRWMASQGLLSKPEAEAAQNILISSEFARFDTDWFQLNAINDKVTISTPLEPYGGMLRDLAAGILELLEYTPIAAVGLNSTAHFDLGSTEHWNQVGHRLAPKEDIWDDILVDPGTRRVAIEGVRQNRPGSVNVVVEPSALLTNGVFIEVNDHFSGPEWPNPTPGWAVEVLDGEWTAHEKNANRIFARVTSLRTIDDPGEGSANA